MQTSFMFIVRTGGNWFDAIKFVNANNIANCVVQMETVGHYVLTLCRGTKEQAEMYG